MPSQGSTTSTPKPRYLLILPHKAANTQKHAREATGCTEFMKGLHADCVVDDTPALIARLPLSLPARHYTTGEILREVRDRESRELLELVLGSGLIEVRDPPRKLVLQALSHLPRRLAEKLSGPDASLLALALSLRDECGSVAVATDDYALQEAAARLGFVPIGIRYRGARSLRRRWGGRP